MRRPLLAATALAATGLVLTALGGTAHADAPAPYHDLNSVGGLYLCDDAGHSLRTGSVDAKPFAPFAISRRPAPQGYGPPGASATLYAYQPRKDAYPDRWNGDTLTASSGYQDPARPTTVATALDFSLRDFLNEFPAQWDGTVQLRMYFGSRAHGYNGSDYVSADLRVTGTTWTLLSDPSGACPKDAKAAGAQSSEITVAHLDPQATARAMAARAHQSASPGARSTPGTTAPGTSPQPDAAVAQASSRAEHATALSTVLAAAGAALAGVAAVTGLVTWLRRRRSA